MLFDPSAKPEAKKQRRDEVTLWATQALPAAVRSKQRRTPTHVSISVREVPCEDPGPECAPVHTCFIFVFQNGRRCSTSVPGTLAELKRAEVYHAVLNKEPALTACHEDRPPPRHREDALPDDYWFYASFGIATATVLTQAKRWRNCGDTVAAAVLAARAGVLPRRASRGALPRRASRGETDSSMRVETRALPRRAPRGKVIPLRASRGTTDSSARV